MARVNYARKPGIPGHAPDLSATFADYPTVAKFVTILFSVYVVYWYLQVSIRLPSLGLFRTELLLALVLGAITVNYRPSFASPVSGYLVGLLFSMVVQIPLSYDINLSMGIFTDRVLKFFCMAVFIVAFVKSPRHLKWFVGAFLLACLKMTQEGFIGHITGGLEWQNQGVMRLHGATPNYVHPNSFSGMALGTVPFIFYLFPISKRWVKGILIVLAVFTATVIVFTGSRTGYIGCVGFLGFVFWRTQRKARTLAGLLVAISLIVAFIPPDYAERFNSIFTGHDKEGGSTDARKEILRDAWQIFLSHPLGVGVGAFPVVRKQMFSRTQDTHNLYFEVATNLGIQGLLIFLLFIAAHMRLLTQMLNSLDKQLEALERARPPTGDTFSRWQEHLSDVRLMKQVTCAVQGFLVVRICLGLFGMDLYEIYWWFVMGLTIALFQMEQIAGRRTDFLSRQLVDDVAPMPAPLFRGRERSLERPRATPARWSASRASAETGVVKPVSYRQRGRNGS